MSKETEFKDVVELVNVAWLHPTAGWAHHKASEISIHCSIGQYPEALVRRSQAEELLAAKDADIAKLVHDLNRIKDHETELVNDNAELTARIKELEKINANLMGDDEDNPRYTTKRLKQEIARATEALEAKLAEAKKVFEFFTDASFDDALVKYQEFQDRAAKARAVLGGKTS